MGPIFLEDDSYSCSYCSQTYPSQRDLDIHEYIHGNYVMEAIFDLAVQPRISYMTYEFFTYECRGIESGVFGKESGCAETPEQDYEDEENVSYNGNDLFSTSQSLINKTTTNQQNYKFVSQPLKRNFTPANQQPSTSYKSPVPPPSTSYTPSIPPTSYTPPIPPPSPSYTTIQPLSPSYTTIQPLSPSYTTIQPLSPSYTPPIQPLSPSYTPPIQPLRPSYTNPHTGKFGLIPLPDQHNEVRRERPSMNFGKNTAHNEQITATANADLTVKSQTSFLLPVDHESNTRIFCNEINSSISSCRTEQGSTIGSGSKGNTSSWIS